MAEEAPNRNPSTPDGEEHQQETTAAPAETVRKKVVVVMGATGVGKSRLAIDLAGHIAGVEVVNADSMQVYRGLDVLTNKVPVSDCKGVPHHLLSTIDAAQEFTARNFRDLVIPVIDEILSRNGLPVIVGGTNYYIQALVSPFLVDDVMEKFEDCSLDSSQTMVEVDYDSVDLSTSHERLKEIDPVAANRIHPNDFRKIRRYLSLYASSGILPSDLFRRESAEKWGRTDGSRYSCCFLWVDASLSELDKYVDQRVDCMIRSGLLDEVYEIYNPKADYTKGLRQAIGVREFEGFFHTYFSVMENEEFIRPNFLEILSSTDDKLKFLLDESIDKLKANTRRLVRRQRRRLNQLKTYFGWDLHYIDATEAFSGNLVDTWQRKVIEPCVNIVKKFLSNEMSSQEKEVGIQMQSLAARDLWTQFICEACGNQVLRGAHEWQQHKQGRGHRKRVLRWKKQNHCSNPTNSIIHSSTSSKSSS